MENAWEEVLHPGGSLGIDVGLPCLCHSLGRCEGQEGAHPAAIRNPPQTTVCAFPDGI